VDGETKNQRLGESPPVASGPAVDGSVNAAATVLPSEDGVSLLRTEILRCEAIASAGQLGARASLVLIDVPAIALLVAALVGWVPRSDSVSSSNSHDMPVFVLVVAFVCLGVSAVVGISGACYASAQLSGLARGKVLLRHLQQDDNELSEGLLQPI
jgi:hypothetical protein